MPTTDSTYGGTIPPRTDVGPPPAPVPTTAPAKPAPAPGLAFTGYDVLGTLAIGLALVAAGALAVWRSARMRALPGDALVIPAYGGTPYPASSEVSDGEA